MRTLTLRYRDRAERDVPWPRFAAGERERAGFDADRKHMVEVARDRKSVVFYQEEHATMDDIMTRVARIEALLNIGV